MLVTYIYTRIQGKQDSVNSQCHKHSSLGGEMLSNYCTAGRALQGETEFSPHLCISPGSCTGRNNELVYKCSPREYQACSKLLPVNKGAGNMEENCVSKRLLQMRKVWGESGQ